jgi:hypothetical protein
MVNPFSGSILPGLSWVFGVVTGIEWAIVGTSASFRELEKRPTMARTSDALSVEDVLSASVGMQGLKAVLSTVVQDALQELIEAEVSSRLVRVVGNGLRAAAGRGTAHGPGRCRPRRGMWR